MHVAWLYLGPFLQGTVVTLELTVVSTVVALVAGILGALGMIHGGKILRAVLVVYVELVRGLPPILQLFIIFFGLTQFGVQLDAFSAALIWLMVYGAGYAIEVFRAGIQDVAEGQWEAARSVGMGYFTTLRKIILPQAFALMMPELTNFTVLQLKNTTFVFFIGVADIMYQAQQGAASTEQPQVMFVMAALFYLVLNGGISRIAALVERRLTAYR